MKHRIERLPGTVPFAPGWGRTRVHRATAIFLIACFSATLLAVPLIDFWEGRWKRAVEVARGIPGALGQLEQSSSSSPWDQALGLNRTIHDAMQEFETALEDDSILAETVRPYFLSALLQVGRAGSEEAYVGRDDWLFFRPDVDALLVNALSEKLVGADAANPAKVMAQFAADLAERGIELVLLPLPGKAAIHPEKLAGSAFNQPLVPPGYEAWKSEFLAAWREEVETRQLGGAAAPQLVEATHLLWQEKLATGEAQFLRTDSHWTPKAMSRIAGLVAGVIETSGKLQSPPVKMPVRRETVDGIGDTARMLNLPDNSPFLRSQQIELDVPVERIDAGSASAPVVLLGDSYTNIFSMPELGWGGGAGLAETLARELGVPVERLARNDGGAQAGRQMLAGRMAADPTWIDGKQVVVWQFAVRELALGHWEPVALPDGRVVRETDDRFLLLPPGEARTVEATIASMGEVPRPGSTPYADFLTAMHLTGIEGRPEATEAIVYVFTMRGHKATEAAGLRPGAKVQLELTHWNENELGALNRGELEDLELALESPNFASWMRSVEK